MLNFLARVHGTITDESRQCRWLSELFCAGVFGLMLYNPVLLFSIALCHVAIMRKTNN